MKSNVILAVAVLASAFGAAAIGNASASGDNTMHDPAEAQALLGAKLSAIDAAAAAVKEVPGKVAEIGVDAGKDGVSYEVTVIAADGSEHDLHVDGTSGAVSKVIVTHDNEGAQENDSDFDGDAE
jgi:uncharacterized membrane protein YkoI